VDDVQNLLREFEGSVQRISQLHAQGLNIMEPDAAQRHQVQLDEQVGATRQLSNDLKNRITALKARAAQSRGAEARIHKNQADLVSKKFVERLQDYQNVERDYRAKYRTRVERQFKLGMFRGSCFIHLGS
jgi:syntaxin 1B/2/3